MTTPTFTPPGIVNVSPGTTVDVVPRVRRADFGDGYVQRSGDGLNAISRRLDATFQTVTDAETDALLSFFEERAGYLPFMWTLPAEATPRRWIAKSWKRTFGPKGINDVVASFEEVFDPV